MADLMSLKPSTQSLDRTLPMRVAELANPSRFLHAASLTIPWLGGATVLLFAIAIYRAVLAPDDYQQGATV